MMKRYILPVILTSILPLLLSCEEIIDFKGSEMAPKPVVNSIINTANDVHYISLKKSNFIFSSEDYTNYDPSFSIPKDQDQQTREDPSIKLCINDGSEIKAEKITIYGLYSFRAGNLVPGDKITLGMDAGDLGYITAEETVPHPPVILSVDTVRFYDKDTQSVQMRILIKIKDRPDEKNYYRLHINRTVRTDPGGSWESAYTYTDFFINQDIALSSLSNRGIQEEDENLYRIFPDDLFQGEEYTINVYFPLALGSYMVKEFVRVTIELQALSQSMYLYMRTVEQSQNADVFSQPVKVYTNVKGGYGVLGIYNSTCRNFEILPSH